MGPEDISAKQTLFTAFAFPFFDAVRNVDIQRYIVEKYPPIVGKVPNRHEPLMLDKKPGQFYQKVGRCKQIMFKVCAGIRELVETSEDRAALQVYFEYLEEYTEDATNLFTNICRLDKDLHGTINNIKAMFPFIYRSTYTSD